MKNSDRVAFSPGEFAALFGKSQTWGYRQVYDQKVKTITNVGRMMIPASEVERILDKAGTYDGLKIKVPKKGKSVDPWRQFIKERREAKSTGKTSKPVEVAANGRRKAARARLLKSSGKV